MTGPFPFGTDVRASNGLPGFTVTAYVYPPIWAKLLAWPAHALSPLNFFHGAFLWHMFAILAATPLGYLMLRRADRPDLLASGITAFALLFTTIPVINTFVTNQPQTTVTLMLLLAFLLVTRGYHLTGGALLGLAAAIKLSPLLYALIFVVNRNWRALAMTLTVSGALALVSILVMGWPLHELFIERLRQINGLIVMTKINWSLESLLYQLSEVLRGVQLPDGRIPATYVAEEPLWITITIKAVLLASLAGVLAFDPCLTSRNPPAGTAFTAQPDNRASWST